MSEPNETPPGQLAKYLVGDLGVARRHLERLEHHEIPAVPAVLREIRRSVETCVRRIERDVVDAGPGAAVEALAKQAASLVDNWRRDHAYVSIPNIAVMRLTIAIRDALAARTPTNCPACEEALAEAERLDPEPPEARTPTTSAQVCRRCGGTDMYAEVWTCRQCGPEP